MPFAASKARLGFLLLNAMLLLAMGVTFTAMQLFASRPHGSEDHFFLHVARPAVVILRRPW